MSLDLLPLIVPFSLNASGLAQNRRQTPWSPVLPLPRDRAFRVTAQWERLGMSRHFTRAIRKSPLNDTLKRTARE